jgi:hypothetical protein
MLATNFQNVELPDFVALDKEGQIILVAEVKGFPFSFRDKKVKHYAILRLIDCLQTARTFIPFAMLVDVENIVIFQWDGKKLSEPIISFNTADILSHYEPEFSDKPIFNLYLIGLTEAWLRDLAYHWKSEFPPLSNEMGKIGLLPLLEDGTTQMYC